ncbi:MAG: hypothetical protein H6598_01530 [Flavobacteriales bacterium]|nr:hypothetical protein [Flavobacteriales bacterium]
MNPITKYIVKLIGLILLQIVVIKNIELGFANWWITPFIYFYVILDLPVKFNPLYTMLYAGILGFTIDVFMDTYGMHASASIFIAFIRYYFIPLLLPRDGFDMNSSATIHNFGISKYVFYLFVLTFLYHLWFFLLEKFSFSSILLRFSQATISSFVTVALMMAIHYLYIKDSKR